jgi:hypothetical protein
MDVTVAEVAADAFLEGADARHRREQGLESGVHGRHGLGL